LARWFIVLVLAFATPAVQDALTDLSMWLTDAACCADDCEESGAPCSQQCAHCPCGGVRSVALNSLGQEVPAVATLELVSTTDVVPPSDATVDPPFRPPVS
jgi:hypothetical protein